MGSLLVLVLVNVEEWQIIANHLLVVPLLLVVCKLLVVCLRPNLNVIASLILQKGVLFL